MGTPMLAKEKTMGAKTPANENKPILSEAL
jgi:hypothetical protein